MTIHGSDCSRRPCSCPWNNRPENEIERLKKQVNHWNQIAYTLASALADLMLPPSGPRNCLHSPTCTCPQHTAMNIWGEAHMEYLDELGIQY